MIDELKIHGFFPFSELDFERAVGNIVGTFSCLGDLSPAWKVWYRYRDISERNDAPLVISNDASKIKAELAKGRQTIAPEMGFSMKAWAGSLADTRHIWSEFSITCECIPPFGGPNVLALKLPSTGSDASTLRDPILLARTISSLADIWHPESLSVRSFYRKMMQPHWPTGPVLGWVNYLNADLVRVETLPKGWSWYEGRKEKQIFIFDGGEPSPSNPEHVKSFAEMDQAIQWRRG